MTNSSQKMSLVNEQEHWNSDVDLDELVNDFNEDNVTKDLDIDLEKVAETIDSEDIETDNDNHGSTVTGNSILHVTVLFLLLWASFYGISATALNHLIQYISHLFTIIASKSPAIITLMATFPPSLYMAQKYFKLKKHNFDKLIICAKCESLYEYKNCFERRSSGCRPKVCTHIAY